MAKRKKKKRGETNKPRTRIGKHKSKTKGGSNRSRVAIQVALIGVIGTSMAAIIGVVGKCRWEKPPLSLTPGIPPSKYILELSKPVINPDTKLPDGRCIEAPKISVVAKSSNCLDKDAIEARCGKVGKHQEGEALLFVDRENIDVKGELGGRRLVATFDSKSFITEQYRRTPHGLYRAEFTVFDPRKVSEAISKIEFNYVYKEDFRELSRVLRRINTGLMSILEDHGGLEIKNWNKKGHFVSADLQQEFGFKTNFYIRGFFTVEFKDTYDPSGLDIAICDRWGEKLSVVLADGRLDTFSIKMVGERYGDKGVTARSETISIGRTVGKNIVNNFFKIWIWEHGGKVRCSLYVQHDSPSFVNDSCVHERVIDTSKFLDKFTRIKLKLWKAGVVKLYNLEVAEVPKK